MCTPVMIEIFSKFILCHAFGEQSVKKNIFVRSFFCHKELSMVVLPNFYVYGSCLMSLPIAS